jgi:general stress protein YciG
MTSRRRSLRSGREVLFVQLVVEMGVERALALTRAVALAIRKVKHAERERPKFQERRKRERGGEPGLRKGFAAMDPKRVSEISALGGRAAHTKGTAHEYSKREAKVFGRQGGLQTAKRKRRKGKGSS